MASITLLVYTIRWVGQKEDARQQFQYEVCLALDGTERQCLAALHPGLYGGYGYRNTGGGHGNGGGSKPYVRGDELTLAEMKAVHDAYETGVWTPEALAAKAYVVGGLARE